MKPHLAWLVGALASLAVAAIALFAWVLVSIHTVQGQTTAELARIESSACFSDLLAKVIVDAQQYGDRSPQVTADERAFTLFLSGHMPALCKDH